MLLFGVIHILKMLLCISFLHCFISLLQVMRNGFGAIDVTKGVFE